MDCILSSDEVQLDFNWTSTELRFIFDTL